MNLRCGREGLTAESAEERLTIFGYNKLEEKEVKLTNIKFHLFYFFWLLVVVILEIWWFISSLVDY